MKIPPGKKTREANPEKFPGRNAGGARKLADFLTSIAGQIALRSFTTREAGGRFFIRSQLTQSNWQNHEEIIRQHNFSMQVTDE